MLESRAIRLLTTFVDHATQRVEPMDFTALLYLRDCGYVEVSIAAGAVVAQRTSAGKQFIVERTSAANSATSPSLKNVPADKLVLPAIRSTLHSSSAMPRA
jgi:hypothetical protein